MYSMMYPLETTAGDSLSSGARVWARAPPARERVAVSLFRRMLMTSMRQTVSKTKANGGWISSKHSGRPARIHPFILAFVPWPLPEPTDPSVLTTVSEGDISAAMSSDSCPRSRCRAKPPYEVACCKAAITKGGWNRSSNDELRRPRHEVGWAS